MPKASVIVPVYNVKEYLPKCAASIFAQTEGDFELLLIDDGSTDGSGELCDALAEKDSRARVIHQKNQGLGGARNTGIEAARSDWLLFVDSDDWIEPEVLERTLAAGKKETADLVLFSFRSVNTNGKELGVFPDSVPKNQPLDPQTRKDLLLCAPNAWNKLYRKSLFTDTGVRYPLRVWYEDIRTTLKLMLKARRVVSLDYTGYNYLQRPGSIIQNVNVERNSEILDAFEDILAYFKEHGFWEKYRDELCFLTLFHVYITASVRVIRLDRKNPLVPKFFAYLRENFPDYRQNPYQNTLTRNQKIIFFLLEKRLYWLIDLIFKIKR